MLNSRLRLRAFRQLDEQAPRVPHFELPMPVPHLDHRACHRWRGGQPIEHPIVGEVAVEADLAFFGGKALPGKSGWQSRKLFPLSALSGPFMGCAMDPHIGSFTPRMGLAIEIIQIAEGDSCPIAVLE